MRTPALLFALAAFAATARPADPPTADPSAHLASLVKLYQAYDLPLPPKEAKLYRYAPKGVKAPSPRIGFGLEPDKDGVPTKLLCVGESIWTHPECTTELRPDAKQIAAKEIDLPTILQFKLRGRHDLAAVVFEDWVKEWEAGSEETPEEALAHAAWGCWAGRLCDPKTDRGTVARRLSAAAQVAPRSFFEDRRVFLKHLQLALKPTKAKPGTVEADIDELLDVTGETGLGMHVSDPRYDAVVHRGFEAVPALIDHLGDNRLTRFRANYFGAGGLGGGVRHFRVKDFASHILRGFMADDERRTKTDKEDILRVKAAKAWWEEASEGGEEVYSAYHVLTCSADATWPHGHLLKVIEAKYPTKLPELFRQALSERPKMDLTPLAEAVARAPLPEGDKREPLLKAVGSKDPKRQQVGRRYLRDVDPERFRQIVLAELAKLPASPSEPYQDCHEATFARDVILTTDAKVWEAAGKYLRRADAGIRERWFEILGWATPPETRRQAIEFVAKFLTDATVRDTNVKPELYPEWYATSPEYQKAEVRNRAAEVLGRMLGVKTETSPKWTADEWAKFRDEVTAAVKAAK